MSKSVQELIHDLRTTPNDTLSREGCSELADEIDRFVQVTLVEAELEIEKLFVK
jgi:hypothetical protein